MSRPRLAGLRQGGIGGGRRPKSVTHSSPWRPATGSTVYVAMDDAVFMVEQSRPGRWTPNRRRPEVIARVWRLGSTATGRRWLRPHSAGVSQACRGACRLAEPSGSQLANRHGRPLTRTGWRKKRTRRSTRPRTPRPYLDGAVGRPPVLLCLEADDRLGVAGTAASNFYRELPLLK